jgi:DNA repair protein RecO (recombination protein O)
MSTTARRVQLEPGYLLHHYPWKDSSRILEILTSAHGRIALFANAARRNGSVLPAALQPFGRVLLSWSGRGDTGRLTGAELARPAPALMGDSLMSGFYANELLIKLLPRNDPHPALFDAYAALIDALSSEARAPARGLRLFEKRLLEETGYGLNLASEFESGREIEPARSYRYRLDAGAEPLDGVADGSLIFSGASLLSLAHDELADARSLADARRLLRAALDRCLDGRELRTREVMRAMRAHGLDHGG